MRAEVVRKSLTLNTDDETKVLACGIFVFFFEKKNAIHAHQSNDSPAIRCSSVEIACYSGSKLQTIFESTSRPMAVQFHQSVGHNIY